MLPPDAMSAASTLGTLLLALVAIPLIFGLVLKAPKLVALGFIGVLFMFSDSTWGQLTAESTIYGRGTGIFYFSLINMALLVSGFAVLCKKLATPGSPQLAGPMLKYFLALVFLVFSHIVVGLVMGIDLQMILGYNGIINIFNMLVFMYLVITAFRSDSDRHNLLLTVVALAAIRSLFGLARYAWFGGDTANPYRNFQEIDVKIVFFDIGDNFVASVAAFCAAWLLTSPQARLSQTKRLALFAFLLLQVLSVALSFRRSSLIGLGLMFALLVYRLPGRQKMIFTLFAAGFLSAIATVFVRQRLQFSGDAGGAGFLSALLYDLAPDKGLEDNRFYELYAAAESLRGNWLFGLGTWGSFTGDQELLSYHFGKFDFVHSGFGHIILKTGLAGLLLFCGLLAAFVSYYAKTRKFLIGNALLIADAGFAGFLFWIPTLLIGTPIIEFRTMLLFGLTLALPFVAVGLERHEHHMHIAGPSGNHYVVA
jgi:hypothetical protein